MADLYASVVTNAGNSALIQNNVNGYIFKVVKLEFCSRAGLDLTEAMTWNNMAAANVVYSVTNEEALRDLVRKIQIDADTVQFRIALGEAVGGTASAGMNIGSIGMYIQKYDSQGVTTDAPVLLTVSTLNSEFVKYAQSSGTVGNMMTFYINVKLSNKEAIDNVLIAPTEYFSLPTVDTEKSSYMDDYFNTYLVNNYDASNVPAIAVKANKNAEGFRFFLEKGETISRLSMGGFYEAPETTEVEERFSYMTGTSITAGGFVARMRALRTLSFPNGFNSDGSYRNIVVKLYQDISSSAHTQKGEFCVIAKYDEGIALEIVPAANVFITSENVNNPTAANVVYFIFNTAKGRSYRATKVGGSVETPAFILAKFKVNSSGLLEYYHSTQATNFCSALQLENMSTSLNDFKSEITSSMSSDLVHKANTEYLTGLKYFQGGTTAQWNPSIIIGQSNPVLELRNPALTDSQTDFQAGINATENGTNVSSLVLNKGSFELATWSNQAINSNKSKDLTAAEFIKVDANAASGKVLTVSSGVQVALMQSIVAGYTGNLNMAGKYTFQQDITAPHTISLSTQSGWADLAENYESDEDYPIGTLVRFGGDKDITIANSDEDAEGVISEAPGFLLNRNCEGLSKPVALVGKVLVRVIGAAKKGEYVYHSKVLGINRPGVACSSTRLIGEKILGKVLETNEDTNEKLVMCVVRLTF